MRKTTLFAMAGALIVAGAAGWAAKNTQARVVMPPGDGINPLQIMASVTGLPAEHSTDFSMVFD
jgi:hypothetical protein